jgi:hypothetical protein
MKKETPLEKQELEILISITNTIGLLIHDKKVTPDVQRVLLEVRTALKKVIHNHGSGEITQMLKTKKYADKNEWPDTIKEHWESLK